MEDQYLDQTFHSEFLEILVTTIQLSNVSFREDHTYV